jgi:hypothetical protein
MEVFSINFFIFLNRDQPIRPHNPAVDRLNAAQSNARTRHVFAQIDYLIAQLKSNKEINFEKDWKILNFFVGANDLCACNSPVSPENYGIMVNEILKKVHENIPRVFIVII